MKTEERPRTQSSGRRTENPGPHSTIAFPETPLRRPAWSFPQPREDEFIVVPVGGVGRIGMNWTLYGHNGRWLLVDAGVGFVRDVPGVDVIMPDPMILQSILHKIEGLVVTHAHEDHIGAIHVLWGKLGRRIPIHATPFAMEIIKGRLAEAHIRAVTHTFRPGQMFRLGPFSIATIPVAHSVPEAVGLAIATKAGTIVHTGDWKIDESPVIGHRTSMKAFGRLGDRGVLALVSDSTNAGREAAVPSEREVSLNMEHLFRRKRGLVVVSCFATNVDRMAGVIRAATASNRVVALAGRTMLKCAEAARETGILGREFRYLEDCSDLRSYQRSQMVLLCTGTQAEPRSALDRLAGAGARHLPKIQAGDAVVHSARAIPGHEPEIMDMLYALHGKGAEIFEGRDGERPLHASGHAVRSDIVEMHGLVRPKYALSVHGEQEHLQLHADIAMSGGAEKAPILTEGEILSVGPRGLISLKKMPARLLGGRKLDSGGTLLFPVDEKDLVPIVDRELTEEALKIAV